MTPIYSPPEIYRRKLLRTSWELVGELDEILETNCLLLARLFDKTCGNSRYRRISDDDLSLRTKIAKRNCICLYLNIFQVQIEERFLSLEILHRIICKSNDLERSMTFGEI